MDVPEKTILSLLVHEVLNPFYIFQIFSVVLWLYDFYLYYAACILIVSTSGVTLQMIENISNNKKIRKMARYTCPVQVSVPGKSDQTELEDCDSS